MNKTYLLILLVSWAAIATAQAATYQKFLLSDPGALCLDGSPGAYYVSNGTKPNRFILHFEGGGWCGENNAADTLVSCYMRSLGDLGSSKNYSDTIQIDSGMYSNNQNNDFKDATRVILKYCDGSGHQGSRLDPVVYKGRNMYFRGHNITVAQLDSVDKNYNIFGKDSQIMVSGASAGGLAVFLWTNYITEKSKSGKVIAVPDSGIFLDALNTKTNSYNYRIKFETLFRITNVNFPPPVPECVAEHPN